MRLNIFIISLLISAGLMSQALKVDPLGHSGPVWSMFFSPIEDALITISSDNTIRFWDLEYGDVIRTLYPPVGNAVLSVGAIHEASSIMAAATSDGRVITIDLNTNTVRDVVLTANAPANSLRFTPNGQYLVAGLQNNSIFVISVSTGEKISSFSSSGPLRQLAFSPDGQKLYAIDADGNVHRWFMQVLYGGGKNPTSTLTYQADFPLTHLESSPDGKYLVVAGDNRLHLLDGDGNFIKEIDKSFDPVTSMSFSNEGKLVVAFAGDNEVFVYNLPDSEKLAFFKEHTGRITATAFRRGDEKDFMDKGLAATVGGVSNDIYLWDVLTGKVSYHITGIAGPMAGVSLSGPKENLEIGFTQLLPSGTVRKSFNVKDFKLGYQFKAPDNPIQSIGSFNLQVPDPYNLMLNGQPVATFNSVRDGRIIDYTFIKTGEIVVATSFAVHVFNMQGQKLHRFGGHSGIITGIDLSDDYKVLATASSDQTIKLWNLENGKALITYFISGEDEWICWSPAGYYEASAGGENHMGWLLPVSGENMQRFLPSSSFRDRFHRPERISRLFYRAPATASSTQQSVAAAQQDNEPMEEPEVDTIIIMTDDMPPVVEWIYPSKLKTEVNSKKITLKAKVSSPIDIDLIKFLVQGTRSVDDRGFQLIGGENAREKIIEYELELQRVNTKVQILSKNENGKIISEERIITYNGPITASRSDTRSFDLIDVSLKPSLYLLSIGISDFQNEEYNLNLADDDAMAISKAFQEQSGKNFDQVAYKEIMNSDATKENILENLKWLEEFAKPKDMVAIFVATHGLNREGEFFLLPHDGNTSDLDATCVSWQDILTSLSNVNANILFLLDACHSGQMGVNAMANQGLTSDTKEAVREIASPEHGVVIMSASTGDEAALEDASWGHGAFTYAILEGLNQGKADFKPDQLIFMRELDLYVSERVIELTNNQQHPTTQKPSVISRLPLYQIGD